MYNELDTPPEESTAANRELAQQDQYLKDMARQEGEGEDGADPDKPKLPSGAKYVRSGDKWRLNPKYYARESQLKDAGFLGELERSKRLHRFKRLLCRGRHR